MTNQKHPYDKIFLQSNTELHEYFFQQLADDDKYDFFSLVDIYMQTSDVRTKTDVGNLIALNAGCKRLHESIDCTGCLKKTKNQNIPNYIICWMADVYCTTQWMYNIPSKEISKLLPAKELATIYDKHCSNSLKGACRAIYKEYLTEIKTFDQLKEEKENEGERDE